MPAPVSPTVRRRRLAAELRRLRERSDLTGDEVARRLTWSAAKISRIETAKTGVKIADVRQLLELYGVFNSQGEELLSLARDAGRKGWWEAYSDDLPENFGAFVGMEAEAESALSWESTVIPGLLQTEDYARETVVAVQPIFSISPGQVEARVEARMRRQEVLTRDRPLELKAVIDESALLRRFGSRQVMRAQLQRLIETARLPNVTVHIVPLDGVKPVGIGPFILLSFAPVYDITFHDVIYIEQLTSNLYVEEERDTYRYVMAFRLLESQALDPEQSLELIAQTAEKYWR